MKSQLSMNAQTSAQASLMKIKGNNQTWFKCGILKLDDRHAGTRSVLTVWSECNIGTCQLILGTSHHKLWL